MNDIGQTTIELLLVLGISMVALAIIYALYAEQVNSANEINNIFVAKSSVQKIVTAANTVYLSGSGSEIKVEIEIPLAAVLSDSGIIGQTVFMSVAGNSEAIAVADVNIDGSFKTLPGKYVVYMVYDGNVVHMLYRDFELNKQSISFSTSADTNYYTSVIVRNNSSNAINFFVTKNFSHSGKAILNLSEEDSFVIPAASLQQIDMNFLLDNSASGNYSGSVVITGDVEDKNVSRTIYVSSEVLSEIEPIMIYPKITSFLATSAEQTITKPFSICNKSLNLVGGISWSNSGEISTWFTTPAISGVSAGACTYFDINFVLPAGSSGDENTGIIMASYGSGQNYSGEIVITRS
jgi:hypothetical protein